MPKEEVTIRITGEIVVDVSQQSLTALLQALKRALDLASRSDVRVEIPHGSYKL